MRSSRIRSLLRGGIVLSMDPAIGDLDRGDVLVEDGATSTSAAISVRTQTSSTAPTTSSCPAS